MKAVVVPETRIDLHPIMIPVQTSQPVSSTLTRVQKLGVTHALVTRA